MRALLGCLLSERWRMRGWRREHGLQRLQLTRTVSLLARWRPTATALRDRLFVGERLWTGSHVQRDEALRACSVYVAVGVWQRKLHVRIWANVHRKTLHEGQRLRE